MESGGGGSGGSGTGGTSGGGPETKVIYHLDDEETPYLVKLLPRGGKSAVTLGDLKQVLNKPQYKYFFKSQDADFGVVKEEIVGDDTPLPLYNNRVVCWLELAQGSVVSGGGGGSSGGGGGGAGGAAHQQQHDPHRHHHNDDLDSNSEAMTLPPRGPGVGETRPPSFHAGGNNRGDDVTTSGETESLLSSRPDNNFGEDTFDDTESSITSVSQAAERRRRDMRMRMNGAGGARGGSGREGGSSKPRLPGPGIPAPGSRPSHQSASARHERDRHQQPPSSGTLGSSVTNESSELESSIYDTEDVQSMASSRFTTSTDHTSVSQQMLRHRQKRRSKRRVPAHLARAGSISSVTDSTMSLNCITVTLNMDTVNFLGISIVGQSNKFGNEDCGIYVGSIMKGGAVALDGRIEPGDMILQVNDISFENMSNDDAVRVLRDVVQKPGPIKLVVAKCWDPAPSSSKNYLSMPRQEPVRPIDPGAWVAHTAAVRGDSPPLPPESFIDGPTFPGFQHRNDDRDRAPLLQGEVPSAAAPPLSHFGPHATATGDYLGRCPSVTTLSASSIISSQAETERHFPHAMGPSGAAAGSYPYQQQPDQQQQQQQLHLLEQQQQQEAAAAAAAASTPLTTSSDFGTVVLAMRRPGSGLEVRDRLWLKIKISNAFIGSEVVDWLYANVDGFTDRRDARRYASQLLKQGLIKHTVDKKTFSEQCYYAFGDDKALTEGMSGLTLKDPARNDPVPHLVPSGPPAPHMSYQPAPQMWAPPSDAPSWTFGPMGVDHHSAGSNNTTTTATTFGGPAGGSGGAGGGIYNPAAPPPSANYMQMPYNDGFQHASSGGSGHSGSVVGTTTMRLAGSGSGSESEGRGSTVGSDGGFLTAIGQQRQTTQQQKVVIPGQDHPQNQQQGNNGSNSNLGSISSYPPPAYQAHC